MDDFPFNVVERVIGNERMMQRNARAIRRNESLMRWLPFLRPFLRWPTDDLIAADDALRAATTHLFAVALEAEMRGDR